MLGKKSGCGSLARTGRAVYDYDQAGAGLASPPWGCSLVAGMRLLRKPSSLTSLPAGEDSRHPPQGQGISPPAALSLPRSADRPGP